MISKENLFFLTELAEIVKIKQELLDIKKEMLEYSNHYEFLYLLALFMKPKVVVELGTERGLSMLYMMEGCPTAKFYTIDKNIDAGLYLKDKPVERIFGDSAENANQVSNNIDILFEDTDHQSKTLDREFKAYLPKMRKGGVMIFDDMNTNSCPGAKQWWEDLEYPTKMSLPRLHVKCGMTAIIKE